jgi:hypothetical protein
MALPEEFGAWQRSEPLNDLIEVLKPTAMVPKKNDDC